MSEFVAAAGQEQPPEKVTDGTDLVEGVRFNSDTVKFNESKFEGGDNATKRAE